MTREDGFSFIELMVVLAIISLLSCVAYPAYSGYWIQLKRLEARLALLEISMRLEKYASMSEQGYVGATFEKLGVNEKTERGWYQLSLIDLDDTHYTLIAQPTFKDKGCAQLSCNAQGKHSYQGKGSYRDCWGIN
jgi:prepilin-type N-terminal cleavage/methylation domain-containing protein